MVIDFILYCALAYGTTELIKFRFHKANNGQRYMMLLAHLQRKLKTHIPPANILEWDDKEVTQVGQFFYDERMSAVRLSLRNLHIKYSYIIGALFVAVNSNLPTSLLSEMDISAFSNTIWTLFAAIYLMLMSIKRLFNELNIIFCNNILDLLSKEDKQGLIIPQKSPLRKRKHKELLKADLAFIEFMQTNK